MSGPAWFKMGLVVVALAGLAAGCAAPKIPHPGPQLPVGARQEADRGPCLACHVSRQANGPQVHPAHGFLSACQACHPAGGG